MQNRTADHLLRRSLALVYGLQGSERHAMIGPVVRWAFVVLLATAMMPHPASAATPCVTANESGRALAAPPATGTIGSFRGVTALLTRRTDIDRAAFDVRLRLPTGRCLTLAGPEDPNEMFLFDVTEVRFVPVARGRASTLVILFNMSQIGPGHGTERAALAYRLIGQGLRVRTERRLFSGVSNAAQVARHLSGAS